MEDRDIADEIIEELGDMWSQFGIHPSVGKIWGLLYLKGSMTQDQIKKEIGSSLSQVSQSLHILESLGPVKKTDKKGRKSVYSAETSLKKICRKKIETALRFYINPMHDLLSSREKEIKDKKLKKKVGSMKNKYSKMGTFMKIISNAPGVK